ncbi:MAG: tetratricopeptide repeat protein [Planctomycetales bacterium]|nr:tetratricopeptide repeat protein [Planctomycetales bacterium]
MDRTDSTSEAKTYTPRQAAAYLSRALHEELTTHRVIALCIAGAFPNATQEPNSDDSQVKTWHIPLADLDHWLVDQGIATPSPTSLGELFFGRRRWLWIAGIAAIIIFWLTVGQGLASFVDLFDRFSPSPAMRAFRNIAPAADDETLILLADFTNADGLDAQFVTDKLYDQMTANLAGHPNIRVARLQRPITPTQGSDLARTLADDKDASIVIWGYYASPPGEHLTLHVETPNRNIEFISTPMQRTYDTEDIQPYGSTVAYPSMLKFTFDLGDELAGFSALVAGVTLHYAFQYNDAESVFSAALTLLTDAEDRTPATVVDVDVDGSGIVNVLRFYRGTNYLHMGRVREALIELQTIPFSLDEHGSISLSGSFLVTTGIAFTLIGQLDSARLYFETAQERALAENNPSGYAVATMNLGGIHLEKRDWATAAQYFSQARDIFVQNADADGIARADANLGGVYLRQREWDQAIQHMELALDEFRKQKDSHSIGQIYSNIGIVYERQQDWDRALEYFQNSLDIRQDIGDQLGVAHTMSNLGLVYEGRQDYDLSLRYQQQALAALEQLGVLSDIAWVHVNLGNVYRKMEQPELALVHYEQALDRFEALDDAYGSAVTMANLGYHYHAQGDLDQAANYANRALLILASMQLDAPETGQVAQLVRDVFAAKGLPPLIDLMPPDALPEHLRPTPPSTKKNDP